MKTACQNKQTQGDIAVRVQNFNLWFAANHVLRNISMDFKKKKVTAIIGPSGCGKSTLLRCINRMNDLISSTRIEGEISIDGENVFNKEIDVCDLRTHVGMVFQKPNPFPKTIFDNVAYGLKVQRGCKSDDIQRIVKESLEKAWIWNEVKDRLRDSALSLSGGQQQRLCIARALATLPEVLLLDEPTSALDPQSTARIEELLLELKNHVTVIIVTHNIGQAGRVSDFTSFLYLGELIEYGPTEKLFTAPDKKETARYLEGKFG